MVFRIVHRADAQGRRCQDLTNAADYADAIAIAKRNGWTPIEYVCELDATNGRRIGPMVDADGTTIRAAPEARAL